MKTFELIAPCHFGMESVLKREIDDLIIEGDVELYSNETGEFLASEICETSDKEYDTVWFNLNDISGINNIKVENKKNGINLNTIYINNNIEAIHTKSVSLVNWTRRFDIEMKDRYFYVYDEETKKYNKEKVSIPMMFIQRDCIGDFSNDFYDKNKDNGMTTKPQIKVSSNDFNYMQNIYKLLLPAYKEMKELITYDIINTYIGSKNSWFEN